MKKHLKILSILSIAILASCGGNVSESTSKPTDKPTINETSKPTEAPVVTETAKPTEAPKTEPATEKKIAVESITITNGATAEVNEGETLQLISSVLPEDATDKAVTWSSEDEAVGAVSATGLFTAKEVNEDKAVIIKAKAGEKEASITITVKNVLKAATFTITEGEHYKAFITEGEKETYMEEDAISFKVLTDSGYDIESVKIGEKDIASTAYGFYTVTLGAGSNTVTITTKAVDYKGYTFSNLSLNPHYANFTNDNSVTVFANDWNSNLLVKEQNEEIKNTDSYTVSAHIESVSNAPVDYNQMALGFVVYYQDETNYLIAYTQWTDWDKGGKCREFNVAGLLDNVDVGWHDMWLEGAPINPHDGIDFSVRREKSQFTVSLTHNGDTYVRDTKISGLNDRKTKSLGVFNQDKNPVTYSNITYEKYEAPTHFEATNNNVTVEEANNRIVYTVPANNWKSGFAVKTYKEIASSTKYTISTHLQTTGSTPFTAEAYWGIVLYYESDSDFLMLYSDYNADRPNSRGLHIIGNSNGKPVEPEWGEDKWTDGTPIHPQKGFDISITRDGATFTTKITQGETVIDWVYTRDGFDGTLTGSKVGLWGSGAIGTIFATDFKVTL